MGQQQLLLIVLGVIVVGIAVVVGIQMFGEQTASSNLDSVVSDLQNLSARAHQYYGKPVSMGGGGRSFANITLSHLTTDGTNDNGIYSIQAAGTDSTLVIRGVGYEDGDKSDGGPVTVDMYVYSDVGRDSIDVVFR
jgi:hypothetical protein